MAGEVGDVRALALSMTAWATSERGAFMVDRARSGSGGFHGRWWDRGKPKARGRGELRAHELLLWPAPSRSTA
jgi:hypothetical protein